MQKRFHGRFPRRIPPARSVTWNKKVTKRGSSKGCCSRKCRSRLCWLSGPRIGTTAQIYQIPTKCHVLQQTINFWEFYATAVPTRQQSITPLPIRGKSGHVSTVKPVCVFFSPSHFFIRSSRNYSQTISPHPSEKALVSKISTEKGWTPLYSPFPRFLMDNSENNSANRECLYRVHHWKKQ